jgi:alkaline phosphatase
MKPLALALLLAAAPLAARPLDTSASAEPSWARAVAEVNDRARTVGRIPRARNVILFVGDGMGVSTVTAARIFAAQQANAAGSPPPGFEGGEENRLSFERMPHTALVKTYNVNAQVPDSAGTVSAMTMGAKTRIGVLNLNPGQSAKTCATPQAFPKSLGELARARGMALGVVTTTRITHATPAGLYAHSPNRNWEGADRAYPAVDRQSGCADIASQLARFEGLDVILGGGADRFRPAPQGNRDDGRDLIAEWQARSGGRFVADTAALRALDPGAAAPVLGLFAADHLAYNADADRTREPALAELATFAVRKLQAKRGRGYVLLVEGGRIDHAHHVTNAWRALDETVELAKAVEAVLALVDPRDTLVMVTADHSHVFTIAGYPPRGNDIMGFVRPIEGGEGRTGLDPQGNVIDRQGRPIPTLGYANGPAATRIGDTLLSGNKAPTDRDFLQPKHFELEIETHGGEDVALYATGPGSALVSGSLEQNSIFHIIARALGWR